jgi:hypothetical protein
LNALNVDVLDIDQITVELKPHIGNMPTAVGPMQVRLPQSVIFVNGVWAGYVADAPGSHINIIHSDIPAEVLEVVKAKVDQLRGSVSTAISQVKTIEKNDVRLERVTESDDSLADEDI